MHSNPASAVRLEPSSMIGSWSPYRGGPWRGATTFGEILLLFSEESDMRPKVELGWEKTAAVITVIGGCIAIVAYFTGVPSFPQWFPATVPSAIVWSAVRL